MKFHESKHPFNGLKPMTYSGPNESEILATQVARYNEANRDKGLSFLRSFLANVVEIPAFAAAKPVYAAVNSADPASAVGVAKALLSQTYEGAESHFVNMQIGCFVKKFPFSGDTEVRVENATRKFLRGERRNRHLNALLRARRIHHDCGEVNGTNPIGLDPNPFIHHMRQYISRVIGESPPLEKMLETCRWGPGAVVGVNGQFTHFGRKLLSDVWTVTPAAIPYALTAAKRYPMFWDLLGLTKLVKRDATVVDGVETPEYHDRIVCVDSEEFDRRFLAKLVIVQYNKIAFVPKDADCDRTIASEPLINQWLQLAVDDMMKVMLKRVGLNLRDQRPNQVMARKGSVLGWLNSYCTVDLKNASGSVFTELIRELFPPAWFKILNDLRSPSWVMDESDPVKYQGFVSMGNGYCFPLETLIFASICSAAHAYTGTTPDFRVYGDDIIVRQNESGVVQEYLRYFGFELNPDKSFFFGPFRESCGADWYDGEPVRPVYLDDSLDTLEQRIRAHNALCRLPNRWGEPLAHACRNWFPAFISKLCRPFPGETDEAVDNRHATVPNPWHLRNKTLQCPAWYGLSLRSKLDPEIGLHPQYEVAYWYACLTGSDPERPFAMRRETLMSVKRFYHGGAGANTLPFERNRRETAYRVPEFRRNLFAMAQGPLSSKLH